MLHFTTTVIGKKYLKSKKYQSGDWLFLEVSRGLHYYFIVRGDCLYLIFLHLRVKFVLLKMQLIIYLSIKDSDLKARECLGHLGLRELEFFPPFSQTFINFILYDMCLTEKQSENLFCINQITFKMYQRTL